MEIGKTRKRVLVTVSLLEVLLFGGIHYGWNPLLFVLMDEGLFLDLCLINDTQSENISSNATIRNDNITSCVVRNERFNLIFAIVTASVLILSVTSGFLNHKIGIKPSRTINKIIFITGALFIAFSSKDLPWLVLPGLLMVGSAGLSLMVSDIPITRFLKKGISVYVGLMSGCYASSSALQLLVKVLYQRSVPKMYSYLGISVLFLVISTICTILHPTSSEIKSLTENKDKNSKSDNNTEKSVTNEKESVPTLCSILKSRPFIMHVMWSCILVLRFSYFLGAIYTHIESSVASDRVSYFTNLLGYAMFGGIITAFIAGSFAEAQQLFFRKDLRNVLPLTVTSVLALIVSGLSFAEDQNSLYITFVVITLLRSFLLSMVTNFIVLTFPKQYMSLLHSLVVSLSGTFSLLEYALFSWRSSYKEGLLHVNIFCVVISAVSLLHPMFLTIAVLQKGHDKEESNEWSIVISSNTLHVNKGTTVN